MQREIVHDTLEGFITQLKSISIEKVAFSETNEKRAKQINPEILQVVQITRVDILAYRDSVLYKCSLEDVNIEEIHARLRKEGLDITRRSRNIL